MSAAQRLAVYVTDLCARSLQIQGVIQGLMCDLLCHTCKDRVLARANMCRSHTPPLQAGNQLEHGIVLHAC